MKKYDEKVIGRPVRLTFDSRIVVAAVSGSGYAAMIANTAAEASAMQSGVAVAFHLSGIQKTTGTVIFSFPDDIESEEFCAAPAKLRGVIFELIAATVAGNMQALVSMH